MKTLEYRSGYADGVKHAYAAAVRPCRHGTPRATCEVKCAHCGHGCISHYWDGHICQALDVHGVGCQCDWKEPATSAPPSPSPGPAPEPPPHYLDDETEKLDRYLSRLDWHAGTSERHPPIRHALEAAFRAGVKAAAPKEATGEWRRGVLDAAEYLRQIWDDGDQGNENDATELILLRQFADRAPDGRVPVARPCPDCAPPSPSAETEPPCPDCKTPPDATLGLCLTPDGQQGEHHWRHARLSSCLGWLSHPHDHATSTPDDDCERCDYVKAHPIHRDRRRPDAHEFKAPEPTTPSSGEE